MSDHQAIEVTVTTFANKTTFWSGLASAFGSLTSINWLSYTGAIVAVVGLFISFIFSGDVTAENVKKVNYVKRKRITNQSFRSSRAR